MFNHLNIKEMKSTNLTKNLHIEGGNTVRFEALSEEGRIQLEGSGPIVVEVSVDGFNYKEVQHDSEFEDGICIAPCKFYIGDRVRISATSLTKAMINFNNVKIAERS